MSEGTRREAHTRVYTTSGVTVSVAVNEMGIVEVSEELFHDLLLTAGWSEVTA